MTRIAYLIEKLQSESLKDDQRVQLETELHWHLNNLSK
jgi:hypothetical protein